MLEAFRQVKATWSGTVIDPIVNGGPPTEETRYQEASNWLHRPYRAW